MTLSFKKTYNSDMPNFRRYYLPGSLVFITNVTHNREKIFIAQNDLDLLRDAVLKVQEKIPFSLFGYTILPDHFHWLIEIKDNAYNFSHVMQRYKLITTLAYKHLHKIKHRFNLWQPRFWDHVIRDDNDLKKHLDYIHWNPVKHGYVDTPANWRDSSFSHWVEQGLYVGGWDGSNDVKEIEGWELE